jgi:hypothetical protein
MERENLPSRRGFLAGTGLAMFLPAAPLAARAARPSERTAWRFYAAGTDDELPVFRDSGGAAPMPIPLVSDASGRFPPVYLDPAHSYRATLTTLSGAILLDLDPVLSVAGQAAAANVGVSDSGALGAASVRDFGATGNGESDDWAAFVAAIAHCKAQHRGLVIPAGQYRLSGPGGAARLNFAAPDFHISGIGRPILHFTGTGPAFVLDTDAADGAGIGGMRIENLIIAGGRGTTDGFYSRAIVRSVFRDIEVRNVSGRAFHIRHGVSNLYENLKYSNNDVAQQVRPSHGLYIANNGRGYYTCDCTFINSVMEGFPGTGCEIADGSGNSFLGGTLEGTATGLRILPECRYNSFQAVWLESNSRRDAEINGVANAFHDCHFGSSSAAASNVALLAAKGTIFEGGFIRVIELSQQSADTRLSGVTTSDHPRLGFLGPGTFARINCLKSDTNANISDRWSDILGAAVVELAGGQLRFPEADTPSADPRTLDAYREGRWTPALHVGQRALDVDPSRSGGSYTRIGNLVAASGMVVIRSGAGVPGEARIEGLPFASGTASVQHAVGSIAVLGPQRPGTLQISLPPNSRTLVVTGPELTELLRPGTELIFSILYQAS